MRRSRTRERTLILLAAMNEAYPGQLARAVGITPTRLQYIMFGRLPYFRPDLSLIATGLAELAHDGRGRVYRITARGQRKARSLAKRFRAGERR